MTDLIRQADEMPVTLVVAIAYGTLAVVTHMFGPADEFHSRLEQFGMLAPTLVSGGSPWRLLSYAFLHGNALHLLVNMMSLFALAPTLERSLGSLRFAALYLVASVGGGLMVCVTNDPGQPVVGGSGALFGMLGCAVALNMRSGRHAFAFLEFEGPRRLLSTIGMNLALGFLVPFISNAGHIGGLLAGFAFTLLWLDPGRSHGPQLRAWRAAVLAVFVSGVFASVVPVTRFDWLQDRAAESTGPRHQQLVEAFRLAQHNR